VKKSIKTIGALALIVFMLVVLTGCFGNNTIVATREIDEYGIRFSERIEITFDRDDRVESAVLEYDFETEDEARSYYDLMTMLLSDEDIERSGTRVIVRLSAEEFEEEDGEAATREEVIRDLEEDGYTVQ